MKKTSLTRKSYLLASIVALLIFALAIPATSAVTDADIQNGSVMYFVLANNTQNMNGATVKDWSGRANGTIGNMLCPSGSDYCLASNTNSYITFSAIALTDQTAFSHGIHSGSMVNEEILTKDNSGSNFIMIWGATGPRELNTYGGAYTKSPALTANITMRLLVKRYGIHVNYFVNGTNQTADADGSAGAITTGQFGRTNTGTARGTYYLLALWNRTLSDAEIAYFDAKVAANNSYNPFAPTPAASNTTYLTFISQNPLDITTSNLFGTLLNITYNLTNSSGINDTFLNYSWTGSGCVFSVNGTCEKDFNTWYTRNDSSISSTFYSFISSDNGIYPASYNINETYLEAQIHTANILTSQNQYILITLRNLSSSKNYNIFEIMSNTTGSSEILFCNSSYTFTNPKTSSNCLQFATLNSSGFNHTHAGNNSKHNVFSFPINTTTGKIGGIGVSEKGYFLIRGPLGGFTYIYNSAAVSGEGYYRNSSNSFSSYSNMSLSTIDAHIHQYLGNESFKYTGCVNISGNITCDATIKSDTLDVTPLPPTIPEITNPSSAGQNASQYFNITWTASAGFNSSTYISGYNVSILNNDSSFNQTITGNTTNTSYYLNLYNLNLSSGSYRFKVVATDSLGQTSEDISEHINQYFNAVLNVTARYIRDNSTIANFTINITDVSTNATRSTNTTSGYILFDILRGRNYTLVLDAEGYAITNETYATTNATNQNTSIEAYTNNAVDIYIYDETTFLLVSNLIYVTFTSNASETIYNTSNGTLYRDGLIEGTWSIKFSGSNYTTKTYSVTVGNRSSQTLNAYLSSSYSTVTFTITNIASGSSLEGASVTMERLINSTWTITESKLSDITGRAQFSYLPAIKYKFTVSLAGYSTKIFYLDPVIFASYTVGLTATASTGSEADYSDLSISHYPKTFYNDAVNNITFIISSPTGKLLNYSFNISAPGGNNASLGSLANGESFLLYFNISGATFYDRVNVSYSYLTTDGSPKEYFFQYEILNTGSGNYTISKIKTTNYGLGMFEKAFIAMLFICILAGGAYLLAGMGGALVIGLIMEGFAVYLGFLPVAAFLISALAGFLLIVSGGMGGKT